MRSDRYHPILPELAMTSRQTQSSNQMISYLALAILLIFSSMSPSFASNFKGPNRTVHPFASPQSSTVAFSALLPDGVFASSHDWGDYDQDGDQDLVILGIVNGQVATTLYTNNAGAMTAVNGTPFANLANGTAQWADYDNDGDLDLLVQGNDNPGGGSFFTQVWNNAGGTFSSVSVPSNNFLNGGKSAWVDYDNDGDQDLMLAGFNSLIGSPQIDIWEYSRAGGFQLNSGSGLPGYTNSAFEWADYDRDGDQDLLISGFDVSSSSVVKLFLNNGSGVFQELSGLGVTWLSGGSLATTDLNQDGYPDFVLTGVDQNGTSQTHIYRNTGGTGFQQLSGLTIPGMTNSSTAWGDYDNDGDQDLLINGTQDFSLSTVGQIWNNNGNLTFSQSSATVPACFGGRVSWVDIDNDLDLDAFVTGGGPFADKAAIGINAASTVNTLPTAPIMTQAVQQGCGSILLAFGGATDAQTAANGLTYNIRIGTSAGANDLVSGMADRSSGYRLITVRGQYLGTGGVATAILRGFPAGTYFVAAQAIDGAFEAGPWSAELSVTVVSDPEMTSTLSLSMNCSTNRFVYSPTFAGTTTTYSWTRAAVAGVDNPAVTAPQPYAPNETLTNTSGAEVIVTYVMLAGNQFCTKSYNVEVRVASQVPTPSISYTGSTNLCAGQSIVLTSSSSSGNLWSNGETTQSIIVTAGGLYTVSVIDGGCTSATAPTVGISVVPVPTPVISGDLISCGPSTTLSAGRSTFDMCQLTGLTDAAPANVIGSYSFCNNFQDGSGNGNHLTSPNFPPFVPSRYGGTAEAVNVYGFNYLSMPATNIKGDFSFGFWIKTTETGGGGTNWFEGVGVIEGDISNPAPDLGISIMGGRINFGIGGGYGSDYNGDKSILSATAVNDNVWHYVVATRNKVSGRLALYIDGQLSSTGIAPYRGDIGVNFMAIGWVAATGGGILNGSLDDIVVYNKELNLAEVTNTFYRQQPFTQVWSNGQTGPTSTFTADGSYTYTETGLFGCQSVTNFDVDVNFVSPVPTIQNASPATYPAGGSVVLSVPSSSGYTYTWSNGQTGNSITVSTLGTFTVVATRNGVGCPSAPSDPVVVRQETLAGWVWNGFGAYNNPANWALDGVMTGGVPTPAAGLDIIIQSGVMVMFKPTGAPDAWSFKDVTIYPSALVVDSSFTPRWSIGVTGNLTNNGTIQTSVHLTEGASVVGNGTNNIQNLTTIDNDGSNPVLIGADINIFGDVFYASQVPIQIPSHTIRLKSSATHTAGIYPISAPATGQLFSSANVVVERHIDAGQMPSGTGSWYNLATPLLGQTVNSMAQNGNTFATATFDPGQSTGSSFYFYDPTNNLVPTNNGYYKATSGSQQLGVGQGARVWVRKASVQSNPFEFRGLPLMGTHTFSGLNYCPGNCTYTGTFENGWNLVGNPYPATIDWSGPGWAKQNLANVIYVRRNQVSGAAWAAFVDGVGTNGGRSEIAAGQAFFVQAIAANPALEVTELAKSASSASLYRQQAIANLLKVNLIVSGNQRDEVALRLHTSATAPVDPQYDAVSMSAEGPALSLVAPNGQNLAIDSRPDQFAQLTVPIAFKNLAGQTQLNLTFTGITSFVGYQLFLDHASFTSPMPINEGMTLALNTSLATGLKIVVNPLVTSLKTNAGPTFRLYPNPATTTVILDGVRVGELVQIQNSLGQTVLHQTINNDQQINVNGLPAGVYWVMIGGQRQRFVKQ